MGLAMSTSVLPVATIGSMLGGLAKSVQNWISSGTVIIGDLILLVGIVCLLLGLHALYKQQPSGKFFLVAILAIAIGGYISNGFDHFGSFSQSEGKTSISKALNKDGDTDDGVKSAKFDDNW